MLRPLALRPRRASDTCAIDQCRRVMSDSGRLLTFEGIDGSGKSTQARLLAEALRARGREVVLTREPGGSPGAEQIRRLLVDGEPGRWSPETEVLLFTAARRDHLERTILPALARGAVVISDRFVDSTRVYQGERRADLVSLVDDLQQRLIGREPDLTFVIDVDPDTARRRGIERGAGEARFEEMGAAFQRRLREGFVALAHRFPHRCRLVNGDGDAALIAAEVVKLAEPLLRA